MAQGQQRERYSSAHFLKVISQGELCREGRQRLILEHDYSSGCRSLSWVLLMFCIWPQAPCLWLWLQTLVLLLNQDSALHLLGQVKASWKKEDKLYPRTLENSEIRGTRYLWRQEYGLWVEEKIVGKSFEWLVRSRDLLPSIAHSPVTTLPPP